MSDELATFVEPFHREVNGVEIGRVTASANGAIAHFVGPLSVCQRATAKGFVNVNPLPDSTSGFQGVALFDGEDSMLSYSVVKS